MIELNALSVFASALIAAAPLPKGCPPFVVETPRESAAAKVIRAADYGLSESSDNNAAAIMRALAAARREGARRVNLAPGTYRCFDEPGIVLRDFTDFTFDGKGAVLVFRRKPEYRGQPQSELILDRANVLIENCTRTLVENFTSDWDYENDPLGAFVRVTGNHIDEKNGLNSYVDFTFVDWERHPRYPESVPVQKFSPMEEDRVRFRRGTGLSCGQTEGHFGAKNEWVAPNVLRVWPGVQMPGRNENPLTGFKTDAAKNTRYVRIFKMGWLYRLLHVYYGPNAFVLASGRHVTLRDLTVWGCFGMGMVTDGKLRYAQVERFRVVPPTREEIASAYPDATFRPRPVTSTADGFHVARSQGYYRLLDCKWTINNDDSINFHDRFTIAVRGNSRMLNVVNRRGAAYFRVAVGAEIELRKPNFAPTGFRARVTSVEGERIYVDRDLPPQEGQCFLVWDRTYGTDNVEVRGCVFEDSGWRNIFSPSNLTIEDCVFRRTYGMPLRFIADYRADLWCEGMGATNIVVRGCTFEDVSVHNPKQPCISAVCVVPTDWDVGKVEPGFVGGNTLIEKCTFIRPVGPVIDMSCGRDVIERDNKVIGGK